MEVFSRCPTNFVRAVPSDNGYLLPIIFYAALVLFALSRQDGGSGWCEAHMVLWIMQV
jgi:hypothetical protein